MSADKEKKSFLGTSYSLSQETKKVAQRLSEAGYNVYCPLQGTSPVERPYQGGGRATV